MDLTEISNGGYLAVLAAISLFPVNRASVFVADPELQTHTGYFFGHVMLGPELLLCLERKIVIGIRTGC